MAVGLAGTVTSSGAMEEEEESVRSSSRQRRRRHTRGLGWDFRGHRDMVDREGMTDTQHTHTRTHPHLEGVNTHAMCTQLTCTHKEGILNWRPGGGGRSFHFLDHLLANASLIEHSRVSDGA